MHDAPQRRVTGRAGHTGTTLSLAAVAATLGLLAAACGSPGGSGAGAAEVRAEVPRADASSADPAAAVDSIDGLGAELYRRLAADPGNLVFSPYSVAAALAMTRNGAVGDTRSQMDAVLHTGSGDQLDAAMNALDQALAARAGHRGGKDRNGDVALSSADTLFGQQGTPFEQPFLDVLARDYGAGMQLVDYAQATEDARQAINRWTAQQTHDKIVDLIAPGVLDAMTRLVLVNAVYFKAPWAQAFEPAGDQPFTRPDGSTVSAPAMTTAEIGTYRQGPGWRAAEIPYLGDELAMDVIVPDDLATFEAGLDASTLHSIATSPAQGLTQLQMPTFTLPHRGRAQGAALGHGHARRLHRRRRLLGHDHGRAPPARRRGAPGLHRGRRAGHRGRRGHRGHRPDQQRPGRRIAGGRPAVPVHHPRRGHRRRAVPRPGHRPHRHLSSLRCHVAVPCPADPRCACSGLAAERDGRAVPGQPKLSGLGSRSSNSGSRFSDLAVKLSSMSPGWNMPVCQVAM